VLIVCHPVPNANPLSSTGLIACTLLEPTYVPGLGALANSLARRGFRGRLLAGCRGIDSPPWQVAWQRTEFGWEVEVVPGFWLELRPWEPDRHFAYEKAQWMAMIFDKLAPQCAGVCYFDPDIVVRAHWGFFEAWVAGGVAVVEDPNADLSPRHPLRLYWTQAVEQRGGQIRTERSRYVNSGFVGLRREDREFLEDWQQAIDLMIEETRTDRIWFAHLRPNPWAFTDQDALNVALMMTDRLTSEMPRSAMDFEPGGYVMSHAIGVPKPWKRKYLWEAIRNGQPPRRADREFWAMADGPLRLYSRSEVLRWRASLLASAALGRLLRRA